jgi:hypothetical protein
VSKILQPGTEIPVFNTLFPEGHPLHGRGCTVHSVSEEGVVLRMVGQKKEMPRGSKMISREFQHQIGCTYLLPPMPEETVIEQLKRL